MAPTTRANSGRGAAARPLSPAEIERFHRDGFLGIPDFTTPADVLQVRQIVLDLYAKFHRLPPRHVLDLGEVGRHAGPQQIPEINWALQLAPELKQTRTFARCAAVAEQLIGCPMGHTGYDHAIIKPPHNACATPWHQDRVFAGDAAPLVSIHFWIPTHDVSIEMGCMQFIPGSHRGPLLPHRRKDLRAHAKEAEGVDASQAVACPLPIGGATVHHSRTLHYTGPNTTDAPRIAWSLEFAPRLRERMSWRSLLRFRG
ncbi:MAG: phytanoyl-CoA dioxygenase family protein [Candidatus Rokuibacteriota bacterium]